MAYVTGAAYSTYPTAVDSFTRVQDGYAKENAFSVLPWNILRHAAYKTETWTQNIARIVGAGSLRVLTLSGTTTTAASSASVTGVFTLTAQQMSDLGAFALYFAVVQVSVRSSGGTEAYRAWTRPVPANNNNQIFWTFDHADSSTDVPAGTYWVGCRILAVG